MLPEMWSSVRQWFLRTAAAEKDEQNVANPGQKEHSMPADSGGGKQENEPTPAKKTVLMLVAPPKDLQQVWLSKACRKK